MTVDIFETPELDKALAPYLIIINNIKIETNKTPGGDKKKCQS